MKDTKLCCGGMEQSEPGAPQTPREAPTPLHSVGLEPPNLQRQLEILKVMYSKRGESSITNNNNKKFSFFLIFENNKSFRVHKNLFHFI